MATALEYKIYLQTDDIRIAHHLTRTVNLKGGEAILAIGVEEAGRAVVHVTVYDWQRYSLLSIFETVRAGARQFNVDIVGGRLERVPVEALLSVVQQVLQLNNVPDIIENGQQ